MFGGVHLNEFMNKFGESFIVIREEVQVAKVDGIVNAEKDTRRRYVGFYPDTDIQEDDKLKREATGEMFYIQEIEHDVIDRKAFQLKAFYRTASEYRRIQNQKQISSGPVFNIQEAHGSIIGTQTTATVQYKEALSDIERRVADDVSSDKEELEQLIVELKSLLEEKQPVQKGVFSKFASLIQRNSWLTSPLATLVLHWLTNGNNQQSS